MEGFGSSDSPPGHESELSRGERGRRKTERTHSGNRKWLSLAKAHGRCETQVLLGHARSPLSRQGNGGPQLRVQDAIHKQPGGSEPWLGNVQHTPFLKPDLAVDGEKLGHSRDGKFQIWVQKCCVRSQRSVSKGEEHEILRPESGQCQ